MNWTLVTGGARRLGAEICLTLAKQGYAIVVHYNTSEEAARTIVNACREIGVAAESIQGDFSNASSTEEFIHRYLERFPNTSNLINNVGNYLTKSGLSTTTKEWIDLFQVNFHSPLALIKALAPSLCKQQGNIINLGVAGLQRQLTSTRATAYFSTKMALWMSTKALAAELASSKVKVNMVSPGYLDIGVDTPSLDRLPMQRLASCHEVTRVIAFLLNQESSYITGQNIEVAGGVAL